MTTKGERFAQEFVVGFGFLSGIFLAVGVDPEGEIIKTLMDMLAQYNPDLAGLYATIFVIISVLVLIATILAAYKLGGILGLIAIFSGFAGGLLIISQPVIGIILLIIGFILGENAPKYCYRPI